ncbi:hypothetical protein ABFW39_002990 [Listeria monocytogenes]|nr:hypothetical protein [Listeria monocytogenes]EHM3395674.1 hypothetical protein [Listeria monocytogenes]MBF2474149.1 hypothetical protein [Listeria welshimeri]
MGNRRQRFKYSLKTRRQVSWSIITKCLMVLFVIGMVTLILIIVNTTSDEMVKNQTQDYIEIQLGDEYQLAAWDYDYFNCPLIPYVFKKVEVSYIGIDSETGKKKEVMEEDISLSKIVEANDKEKTKKRLEKEIKTAN